MEHFGKIIGYCDGAYQIEVSLKADECGGCSAAMFCGTSNGDRIVLRADAEKGSGKYEIGRRVRIQAKESDRMDAIVKLLLLPLSVFILVALIATLVGANELVVGLSALLSVAIVYLTLYFIHRRNRERWTIIQVL